MCVATYIAVFNVLCNVILQAILDCVQLAFSVVFVMTSARRYYSPLCLLVCSYVDVFVSVFVNTSWANILKTVGDRGSVPMDVMCSYCSRRDTGNLAEAVLYHYECFFYLIKNFGGLLQIPKNYVACLTFLQRVLILILQLVMEYCIGSASNLLEGLFGVVIFNSMLICVCKL